MVYMLYLNNFVFFFNLILTYDSPVTATTITSSITGEQDFNKIIQFNELTGVHIYTPIYNPKDTIIYITTVKEKN